MTTVKTGYSRYIQRGETMIYAATDGANTLIIEQETDPVNPRIDYDPFGRMICWHRRYSLGDGHHYESPEVFLRDLFRESIRDGGKRLISFLKSGDARGAKLVYNRSSHEWELYTCYYFRTVLGKSEPSWELEQSAPKTQLNDSGWFFDYMLNALTIDDLKELLSEQKDIVILPLFLYDHSGLSMSTGSFMGRAVHAEWDSGQVGYIYANREDILNFVNEVKRYHTMTKQFDSSVELTSEDRLLVLSTCLVNNDDQRFLVIAKLVSETSWNS